MNNNYQGIIFDFNGTLFWDSAFHEEAWRQYSFLLRKKEFSNHEITHFVHGRVNRTIIEYLLKRPITDHEAEKHSAEKEDIYLKICAANKDKLYLAPGAEKLLDFLKQRNIPRNIATASGKSNLEYYMEVFQLDKWFIPDLIVYNDGTFPGKPDPHIFQLAASRINLKPEDCIIIEDSYSGIRAACAAKTGKVIYIESSKTNITNDIIKYTDTVIKTFDDIDRKSFRI